ncbi:hypothetical protein JCM1840_004842 [Sporobolomyces johnsonii]
MESPSAPGPPAPAPAAGPSSLAHQPSTEANAHASTSRGSGNLSAYLLQPDNPYPSPLSGTQDLISLFHLEPLYNTFLRPYLPPPPPASSSDALAPPHPPAGADSPAPAPVKGAVGSIKGKEKALDQSHVPPQGVGSPGPGGGGGGGGGAGLKITLGGIKFGGATAPAAGGGADAAAGPGGAAGGGKPKKLKMDKSYAHMVSDILGRNTIKKSLDLSHLVLNPDPTPCPPLHPFDAQQLRDAFTLKPGGLAGFDMGIWEKDVVGAGGEAGKKKKKKRKADAGGDPHAPGAGGGDHKKRKSGG